MDKAATRPRPGSSKRAEPTQDGFLQLVRQYDNLLSRQSILLKQKSEQRTEEIQKRLSARFGSGPRIVDNRSVASLFTDEELDEPTLAPIREMAVIEHGIHATLVEIKEICTEISLDGFMQKLFRKGKSPEDWEDYLNSQNQIAAHLLEKEIERDGSRPRRGGATRRRKTSDRDVAMAVEYVEKRAKATSSPTALKTKIGKRHRLSESASNAAINKELEYLGLGTLPSKDACSRFCDLHRDALAVFKDPKIDVAIAVAGLRHRLKAE